MVLAERGYVVVGTSPGRPPFEYLDPKTGELVGYGVELVELIARELDLRVERRAMSFATTVKNKEIDLGVSGFSIIPERLEEVRFTIPHIVTESQVIMLKGGPRSWGSRGLRTWAKRRSTVWS